ncbi:MAG: hypothetical protein KBD26_03780 [Candidatus Pacebacteria bacterium]|nr:hypothetical protein [Candidatus Paceibacterota bacterium]MBP9772919.1 hypothetical protein [Candidatus Paceibacterota bacterium]
MQNKKQNIGKQIFKNPGKKIPTQSGGFMINFHGFCFFVDTKFKYRIWKKTYSMGILPPTNEYGRLKGIIGADTESLLTEAEENLAREICRKLEHNPFWGMSKRDIAIAKGGSDAAAMKLIENADHRATVGDFMAKQEVPKKGTHTGRW